MRYALGILLVVACLVPTWASEPGEPLDCSDWVSVEPGYTCVEWMPDANSDSPTRPWLDWRGSDKLVDNEGRLLRVVKIGARTEVQWFDGQQEGAIGYFQDRTFPVVDSIKPETPYSIPRALRFDQSNGRLLLPLQSGQPRNHWIAAIEGFTTTFEILQTYTPSSGPISFRVPYMPEGFQYADSLDTYYGDLSTVGDWSQAQPLQCDYPSTAPSTGDYLTVADPLPGPAPGTGRYYVTAVTHQGQTRYGRKNIGGLSGRDPGVLQACDASE